MESLLSGKRVRLVCGDFDKYGRILGTVYALGPDGVEVNVNQAIIDSKLVFPYGGESKLTISQ